MCAHLMSCEHSLVCLQVLRLQPRQQWARAWRQREDLMPSSRDSEPKALPQESASLEPTQAH